MRTWKFCTVKRLAFYFVTAFILFNSCDALNYTDLEIINESSYDLYINFKEKDACSVPPNIELQGMETKIITPFLSKYSGPNSPCNPNNEINKIVFSNLDNKEIIKEINVNGIFKYKSDISGGGAIYQLIITDELLF